MSKHPYHERKVRQLEAERDKARREIEQLKERLETKADVMDRLEAERDEAWAEIERLRVMNRTFQVESAAIVCLRRELEEARALIVTGDDVTAWYWRDQALLARWLDGAGPLIADQPGGPELIAETQAALEGRDG